MIDLKSLLDKSERKKDLKHIFSIVDGKIKVGWRALKNRSSGGGTGEGQGLIDEAYNIMVELELLSNKSKGNYLLLGNNATINPSYDGFGSPYYFTRFEDAEAYQQTFHRNAQFTIKPFIGM